MQHESGYGDYAAIKRQLFKNKSVNDMYDEMKGKTK
jgi:antirestriction protein